MDVFISASRLPKTESVELRLAGHSFSRPFTTQNDFGEQRLEFEVPEWTGAADATVHMGDFSAPPSMIESAKKWTIAIIPHEHLDIGFTDYPAKVAELHSQSIDAAMELIKKSTGLSVDARWKLGCRTISEWPYLGGTRAVSRTRA